MGADDRNIAEWGHSNACKWEVNACVQARGRIVIGGWNTNGNFLMLRCLARGQYFFGL